MSAQISVLRHGDTGQRSYRGQLDDPLTLRAQWLPDSGYTVRDAPLHYLYLDDPEAVAEAELRADICVPVELSTGANAVAVA